MPSPSEEQPEVAPPNTRELLLKLLISKTDNVLDAGVAIRACALFDISANNVRVALNRLVSGGVVDLAGRGAYRLGAHGLALGRQVAAWRDIQSRVRPWAGDWLMVLTDTEGRGDRKAIRAGSRALALLGFRELHSGVNVRPSNLSSGVSGVREQLYSLGLGSTAPVFVAQDLDEHRARDARGLWDVRALEAAYLATSEKLSASLSALGRLTVEEAAKEAWVLGDQAIRQLVFDPLLPAPLIDETARDRFLDCVRQYDERGIELWRQLLA